MRYKYFAGLFTTAALAGALTLSAAPQAENPNYQQTTVTETKPALSDHRIRREIRKEIFNDPTMSQRARAVKVMCMNGQVTLQGTVRTSMEKEKIEDKAVQLAGSANVNDQIRVKAHHHVG
jgi:osmotically-inducible protein OsmY